MNRFLLVLGLVWFLAALFTAIMIIYGYRIRRFTGRTGVILLMLSYLSGMIMLGYAIATI